MSGMFTGHPLRLNVTSPPNSHPIDTALDPEHLNHLRQAGTILAEPAQLIWISLLNGLGFQPDLESLVSFLLLDKKSWGWSYKLRRIGEPRNQLSQLYPKLFDISDDVIRKINDLRDDSRMKEFASRLRQLRSGLQMDTTTASTSQLRPPASDTRSSPNLFLSPGSLPARLPITPVSTTSTEQGSTITNAPDLSDNEPTNTAYRHSRQRNPSKRNRKVKSPSQYRCLVPGCRRSNETWTTARRCQGHIKLEHVTFVQQHADWYKYATKDLLLSQGFTATTAIADDNHVHNSTLPGVGENFSQDMTASSYTEYQQILIPYQRNNNNNNTTNYIKGSHRAQHDPHNSTSEADLNLNSSTSTFPDSDLAPTSSFPQSPYDTSGQYQINQTASMFDTDEPSPMEYFNWQNNYPNNTRQ